MTLPERTAAPLMWHVRFNGKPTVMGHVCDRHHAQAQAIPCHDAPRGGDCEHVQTAPCDCTEPSECSGCRAEATPQNRAVESARA